MQQIHQEDVELWPELNARSWSDFAHRMAILLGADWSPDDIRSIAVNMRGLSSAFDKKITTPNGSDDADNEG